MSDVASDINLESLVISLPDYPHPPVVFKDVTPVFADPKGFRVMVDRIAEHFAGRGITKVVSAEARGFMVGAPVAYALGAGFIPARKPGKLPREVISESYVLEYGTDTLEIHADALSADDVVLLVDDLIASGGTAQAQVKLVESTGARVEGLAFLMELAYLNPREALAKTTSAEVYSEIIVESENRE